MRIGIDFDNTIASYDRAFVGLAEEKGVVPANQTASKTQVRDFLRAQVNGENLWRQLQGRVYGAEINRAELFSGIKEFFDQAKARGDEVFIVSHKTEFGHFDPDRVNLREAALQWMKDHGFFEKDGFAIAPENVFFFSTREEKIAQIEALDLDWFIDDLPEVLMAEGFPNTVKPLWFSNETGHNIDSLRAVSSWSDIGSVVYSK